MARPMLLIPEQLLKQCAEENKQGIPVSFLIRKYKLDITHPTLCKLINYVHMTEDKEVLATVRKVIKASLFPEWLPSNLRIVVKQTPSYRYIGKFPLGKWELNEWAVK